MNTSFYLDTGLEIICTVLCPPLGLVLALINLRNDPVNWRRHIMCIAWGMASFAYCFQTIKTDTSDLTRYFAYCEKLSKLPLNQIWGDGIHGKDTLYAFEFLCWIVGRIGDKHLLPANTVFWVYYIGMYATCTVAETERYSMQQAVKYIYFMLLALSFHNITNNVRNVLAFALIGYAIFRECYEKKRGILTAVLYVLPCFLHQSAVVFIIVRLLMGLVGRAKAISTLGVLVVPGILDYLDRALSGVYSGNPLISMLIKMIHMGNRYFHDETSSWSIAVQNSGAQKVARVAYMAIVAVMLYHYVLLSLERREAILRGRKIKPKSSENLAFFALLLTLSCLPMTQPQYWRFVTVLIMFGGCVYLGVGNSKDFMISQKQNLIFIPMLGALMFWVREMFLYAEVGLMFIRSLICNPFSLLILRTMGSSIEFIQ